MIKTTKTLGVIGVLLSLLGLSACGSPATTSAPTMDLNPFRTEVAATVLAQVTQDLARTPSITPTPSPTVTTLPTRTPVLTASVSPGPVVSATGGTPGVITQNQAEWVSQSISDGTVFAPGETFTITWRLKNVGTSIWSVAYMLRFYSGEPFGAANEIPIGQIVTPGNTVEISVPMKAPVKPGDYRTDWVLANENRSNFREPVFLKITVANPPTPTATTTAAPTASATSTRTPSP